MEDARMEQAEWIVVKLESLYDSQFEHRPGQDENNTFYRYHKSHYDAATANIRLLEDIVDAFGLADLVNPRIAEFLEVRRAQVESTRK